MCHLPGNAWRALVLAILLIAPTAGQALTLSERAVLQAEIQRYIDSQLVDGAYLFLDTSLNETRVLHPVTAHPMILKMGEHYVLCFDFKDGTGNKVLVDYYVAWRDDSFVVFHTAIANRALLYRLMKSGVVTKVDG